jgi:L-iditol 2-dehydrogenase
MRVAMYYGNNDVRNEEMSVPRIGPGEILVKVMASGICGSDAMEWYRIRKAPLVLGHEIAGIVAAVGEGVTNWRSGDRVFVSHHIPCNTCHYCLQGYHTACETLHSTNYDPGGFAEYLRVPRLNVDRGVFLLPADVSFAAGAMIEPLACVIRGQRLARLQPGQAVLVLGSGISGILHIMLARTSGAGRIMATDINAYRRDQARTFGADAVSDAREDIPAWVRSVNDERPADLVIVCTGAPAAFAQALQCVDRGGTILCFATTEPGVNLSVPLNDFWRNEIKLMPSYGNSPADAMAAIALIRLNRLPAEKMISHRLPLAEAQQGFHLVAAGTEAMKVILLPHG